MNSEQEKRIHVTHLKKAFGASAVLEDISVNVNRGELVSILGPSGCGKSTLLNIITGLLAPDSGEVHINGNIGYMQQKDLLLPWKNVLDNITLPAMLHGTPKKKAAEKALDYLDRFGLAGYERNYPYELSGGMRQRASFLRTFLSSDDIMLFDEPFGALDSITRSELQKWLLEVQQEFNITILFITHDVDEAILLSDRIYVLSDKPSKICGELVLNFHGTQKQDRLLLPQSIEIRKKILELLRTKRSEGESVAEWETAGARKSEERK